MEIKKIVFALFAIFTVLLSIGIVCADDMADLSMGSAMDSYSIGSDSIIAEDISIADNGENNLEEKSLLRDSFDDGEDVIRESLDENPLGEGNPLSFKNLRCWDQFCQRCFGN